MKRATCAKRSTSGIQHAFEHDFFCSTGDAHAVYYWAFGWVTNLGLSLDAVAWIGRVATWLLLAIAWRGLSYSLIPRPWLAVLSAQLFVMLTEQAHMAGEWIVGGVEAKGFAWALVLWVLQKLVLGRWNLACILLGIATSLHVLVGGWGAICLALVWFFPPGRRPALPLVGAIVGTVLAIPGLYFAGTLNAGVEASTIAEANRIQVFERLPHHLLPAAFQTGYVPRHLLLWALFAVLCLMTPAAEGNRFFRQFVAAAIGLALVGFVLGLLASMSPSAGCFDPAILLVPHDRHSAPARRGGCRDSSFSCNSGRQRSHSYAGCTPL